MSDSPDKDSQTEAPTEKKLTDAMERGETPVSREVALFATMAAAFVALSLLIPRDAGPLMATLVRLVDDPGGWRIEREEDVVAICRDVALASADYLWPIFAVVIGASLVASFAQNAPRLVVDRIMPDWGRLSPRRGLARILGLRGWVEFFKSVAKLAAVIGVVSIALSGAKDGLLSAMYADIGELPARMLAIAVTSAAAVMTATLVIGFADLTWARLLWLRDHRMSRQEVKEETRQAEGDRMVKGRMRSLQMDRSRRRMLSAVPRATMVVVNPTHYAVALRYVRSEGGAPIVLAKGADKVALRIREIAESENIPIVEDRLLARSLYAAAALDAPIPAEFYRAVAEIVHAIRGRVGSGVIDRNGVTG